MIRSPTSSGDSETQPGILVKKGVIQPPRMSAALRTIVIQPMKAALFTPPYLTGDVTMMIQRMGRLATEISANV
jgi:hypothetical protein